MATRPDQPLSNESMGRNDWRTGLPNRRAWDEEVRRELARARRGSHAVSVALVELDDFGSYRHANGAAAADSLLREAAHAWRLTIRVCDLVARLGVDRFAVLLPECAGYVLRPLERLRAATPEAQTSSAGIAIWDSLETAERLVARSEAALDSARERGGDCAVLAEH
jgi:diguanylate cyclase